MSASKTSHGEVPPVNDDEWAPAQGSSHVRPPALLALEQACEPGLAQITAWTTRPAHLGESVSMPEWVAPPLVAALAGLGITELYRHQEQVAQAAWEGRHIAIATGTASGKSLAYQVPVLSALLEPGSQATALYLSPTKALAADQLANLARLALPGLRAATYDGDTSTQERAWVRQHAQLVLTNPDLVHFSMLPGHPRWRRIVRNLRFIVIDECHSYRGLFGTHVSLVLRRLLRVAAHYGATPTVIFASATVSDPASHARALIGQEVEAVSEDSSPRAELTLAMIDPAVTTEGQRRSTATVTSTLMGELIQADRQTLAFARSRSGAEVIALAASELLQREGSDRWPAIQAYRGGHLPEERRAVEAGLRSKSLWGVAATNALELGVDIRGLDAVLMAGWPGRMASYWQQAGRAGRSGQEALAALIAADDPLDSYLVEHPEAVWEAPVEATVIDPSNPRVMAGHVAAAAAEIPVTLADDQWFGASLRPTLASLTERGLLRRRPGGWFWARDDRPTQHVSLRDIGAQVSIVEESTGRIVGTVDSSSAPAQVHAGAVHLHQGQEYLVHDLDLADGVASVSARSPGWSTRSYAEESYSITRQDDVRQYGQVQVHTGMVRIHRQVTSYVRMLPSGEVIGQYPLDSPVSSFSTQAIWWTMPAEMLAAAGIEAEHIPGALHAAEHAAIGMLPLFVTCDRWDIGGLSTADHQDTGLPTIVIYDGHENGAGITWQAFTRVTDWLNATRETIADCPCEAGCPRCVQSPKCGSGNDPLSKPGAVALLTAMAEEIAG